jgi:hypothetical protein
MLPFICFMLVLEVVFLVMNTIDHFWNINTQSSLGIVSLLHHLAFLKYSQLYQNQGFISVYGLWINTQTLRHLVSWHVAPSFFAHSLRNLCLCSSSDMCHCTTPTGICWLYTVYSRHDKVISSSFTTTWSSALTSLIFLQQENAIKGEKGATLTPLRRSSRLRSKLTSPWARHDAHRSYADSSCAWGVDTNWKL